MISTPYDKYRQSSVQTSTPAQLLLMLYDGAIRFIRGGIEGINEHDHSKANNNINKAQTIISELMITLNHSYEVAQSLSSLYEYINRLLIESNIKKNAEPAEEALGYMLELRDTWAEAAKSTISSHYEDTNG